jgi:hypothetical protein
MMQAGKVLIISQQGSSKGLSAKSTEDSKFSSQLSTYLENFLRDSSLTPTRFAQNEQESALIVMRGSLGER